MSGLTLLYVHGPVQATQSGLYTFEIRYDTQSEAATVDYQVPMPIHKTDMTTKTAKAIALIMYFQNLMQRGFNPVQDNVRRAESDAKRRAARKTLGQEDDPTDE